MRARRGVDSLDSRSLPPIAGGIGHALEDAPAPSRVDSADGGAFLFTSGSSAGLVSCGTRQTSLV